MDFFRNMKIRVKLMLSFLIMIIFMGVIGYTGYHSTKSIQHALANIFAVQMPSIDFLIEADRDLQQLLVAERSMIFVGTDSEEFKQLLADYEENLKQAEERLGKFEALPLTDEEKNILKEYKKARAEWYALSKQIVDGRKSDTREGRRMAIDLTLAQAGKAFEIMREKLNQLQEMRLENVETEKAAAKQTFQETYIFTLIITAIAILLVFILLTLLNKTVIRPIQLMVRRGKALSEGQANLTKRLNLSGKDELAEFAFYFDKFLQRLQEIVVQVKNSSGELLESSSQVATGSQELAARTNQQAASITETSTALEEFSAILRQNSDHSRDANQRIVSFDHEIQSKRELIRNVTGTMSEIDSSSKKIDNIMNVINDISFQTNLLALNAAVEAARAGEAGRGFAVVASEVRNLAQKTAESSKTIQEIVTTNVNSTEKGMELVKETETFFESIMDILSELSNTIGTIENGSREQSTGMEQINQAVMQLEQVINQNAELVGEFAATGKAIQGNARDTFNLLEQFVTDSSGADDSVDSRADKSAKPKKEKPKEDSFTESAPPRSTASSSKPEDASDFFAADEDEFEEF